MSVMVTCVLLNVARIFAMPTAMFFEPLALMIFLALGSSPSNSAAVGAAGADIGSTGLGGSPPSGALGAPLAAGSPFGAPLAGASPLGPPLAGASPAAFAALGSLAGFFGFGSSAFFASSAIGLD